MIHYKTMLDLRNKIPQLKFSMPSCSQDELYYPEIDEYDYPEIIVLDSTLSTTVDSVIETIDVDNALFVVASKSGDTIETSTLFSCFLELVHQRSRSRSIGEHFVAITDPETPLERLANDNKFRDIFLPF